MMKRVWNKFISVLLVFIMVSCIAPIGVFAASDTVATTLRLNKAEGSVTLKNANGKKIKFVDGMKIYNGYKTSTGAKSYVYVSLDENKVIKMDANSKVSIKKSGKKLQVKLISGNLFFNVTKPLEDDENLEIKTSTMSTGIRGTSGIIETIDEKTSQILMLTGKVELNTENASMAEEIKAGQKAIVSVDTKPGNQGQENAKITVQPIKENEISGFGATEIARDLELQKKIEEQTNFDRNKIIDGAEEKLKMEQEQVTKKQEQIEDQKKQEKVGVKPPETVYKPDSGKGNGGGSSGGTPPKEDNISITGNVTGGALEAALASNKKVTLKSDAKVIIDSNVDIPSGKTVNIEKNARIEIEEHGTLHNRGTISVAGEKFGIWNKGTFIFSEGNIAGKSNGMIKNEGIVKTPNKENTEFVNFTDIVFSYDIEEGRYKITPADLFENVADALQYATDGKTVVFEEDYTPENKTVTINHDIKVDTNGFEYELNSLIIPYGKTVEIKGEGVIKSKKENDVIENNGMLSINGANIIATHFLGKGLNNYGTLHLKKGSIQGSIGVENRGNFNMNGGHVASTSMLSKVIKQYEDSAVFYYRSGDIFCFSLESSIQPSTMVEINAGKMIPSLDNFSAKSAVLDGMNGFKLVKNSNHQNILSNEFSAEELEELWNSYDTVIVSGEAISLENIQIPEEKSLILEKDSLLYLGENALENNGKLIFAEGEIRAEKAKGFLYGDGSVAEFSGSAVVRPAFDSFVLAPVEGIEDEKSIYILSGKDVFENERAALVGARDQAVLYLENNIDFSDHFGDEILLNSIKIYNKKDIELGDIEFTIEEGKKVHFIGGNISTDSTAVIQNRGELVIENTNITNKPQEGRIGIDNEGTLTLESGKIEAGQYAVINKGSFTMYSGEVVASGVDVADARAIYQERGSFHFISGDLSRYSNIPISVSEEILENVSGVINLGELELLVVKDLNAPIYRILK